MSDRWMVARRRTPVALPPLLTEVRDPTARDLLLRHRKLVVDLRTGEIWHRGINLGIPPGQVSRDLAILARQPSAVCKYDAFGAQRNPSKAKASIVAFLKQSAPELSDLVQVARGVGVRLAMRDNECAVIESDGQLDQPVALRSKARRSVSLPRGQVSVRVDYEFEATAMATDDGGDGQRELVRALLAVRYRGPRVNLQPPPWRFSLAPVGEILVELKGGDTHPDPYVAAELRHLPEMAQSVRLNSNLRLLSEPVHRALVGKLERAVCAYLQEEADRANEGLP